MPDHRRRLAARTLVAILVVLGTPVAGGAEPGAADPTHRPETSSPAPGPVGAADEGVRVRRRAGVTLSAPGQVATGAKIKVSGRAKVARGAAYAPRSVALQEQLDGVWVEARHTSTDRYGHFALKARGSGGPRVRTFRVVVGGAGGLRPARSAPFVVQVGAATGGTGGTGGGLVDEPGPMEIPLGDWDPAEYPRLGQPLALGNPADWAWLWAGGARWNPCHVIRWGYNPSGGYAGSLTDAQRAFARVAGRTGLHFKYVGPTAYVYDNGNGDYPPGVDVVVGWSDAAQLASLGGGVVGVGGGWAYPVSGAGVAAEIVSGYVVLDRDELLNGGFTTGGMPTWGQVLQHEIGHAVGLGHAHGTDQLMAASAGSGNHLFGAGDLLGLGLVGAISGCL